MRLLLQLLFLVASLVQLLLQLLFLVASLVQLLLQLMFLVASLVQTSCCSSADLRSACGASWSPGRSRGAPFERVVLRASVGRAVARAGAMWAMCWIGGHERMPPADRRMPPAERGALGSPLGHLHLHVAPLETKARGGLGGLGGDSAGWGVGRWDWGAGLGGAGLGWAGSGCEPVARAGAGRVYSHPARSGCGAYTDGRRTILLLYSSQS